MSIWGAHTVPDAQYVNFVIGPLQIWCKRVDDEIWISHEREDPDAETEPRQVPPEGVSWGRWAVKRTVEKLRLTPVFPDLSVVVKPEFPFRVVRGAQARIYISVPVWVRVEQAVRNPIVLTAIPSVLLSKTWFGTFTQGEMCYGITSRARREANPVQLRPHVVTCPIQIVNSSRDELNVEKLSLRVRRLSIFCKEFRLWSDEIRIKYRGESETSEITISSMPPVEAADAKLLTPPHNPDKRGFTAKTFSTLKDLTGLDSLFN